MTIGHDDLIPYNSNSDSNGIEANDSDSCDLQLCHYRRALTSSIVIVTLGVVTLVILTY